MQLTKPGSATFRKLELKPAHCTAAGQRAALRSCHHVQTLGMKLYEHIFALRSMLSVPEAAHQVLRDLLSCNTVIEALQVKPCWEEQHAARRTVMHKSYGLLPGCHRPGLKVSLCDFHTWPSVSSMLCGPRIGSKSKYRGDLGYWRTSYT